MIIDFLTVAAHFAVLLVWVYIAINDLRDGSPAAWIVVIGVALFMAASITKIL